jgi:integrase/recombinase XerD
VLSVRHGKGGKDRVLPVGRAAIHWLRRYVNETRPLLGSSTDFRLSLNSTGKPFNVNGIGNLVHQYLVQAGIRTGGSSHVFRHAVATAMLDHGAEIQFVPEMLGHKRLETTLI